MRTLSRPTLKCLDYRGVYISGVVNVCKSMKFKSFWDSNAIEQRCPHFRGVRREGGCTNIHMQKPLQLLHVYHK